MSRTDINIRYDKAIAQANQLSSCAIQLESAANRYASLLEELATYWEGPSEKVYASTSDERIRRLRRTVERMQAISNALKKTAAVYRKAELAKLAASTNG